MPRGRPRGIQLPAVRGRGAHRLQNFHLPSEPRLAGNLPRRTRQRMVSATAAQLKGQGEPQLEQRVEEQEPSDRAANWSSMADKDQLDRVWEIIEQQGVCMLTTRFAGGLRARPLEARPDGRGPHLVRDRPPQRQGAEIEAEHDVCLVFTIRTKRHISRSPPAPKCSATPPRPRRYGNRPTMCGGADPRPNVRVLRVTPLTAELWDGPASKAIVAYEFAKARLTGAKPNLGENRKVTVNLR